MPAPSPTWVIPPLAYWTMAPPAFPVSAKVPVRTPVGAPPATIPADAPAWPPTTDSVALEVVSPPPMVSRLAAVMPPLPTCNEFILVSDPPTVTVVPPAPLASSPNVPLLATLPLTASTPPASWICNVAPPSPIVIEPTVIGVVNATP